MEASLRAFMEGIIDYAGMFPPSKLSLDEAIRNYARYRKGDDAWMLSRFIILGTKLKQLSAYEDLLSEGEPFDFSVIGQSADTVQAFTPAIKETAEQILAFHDALDSEVSTGAMEVKLPLECVISSHDELLSKALQAITDPLATDDRLPKQVYCEAQLTENYRAEIPPVMQAIAEHNANTDSGVQLAFKLRCGGVKAELFPSLEEVAFVLQHAREANIAMKCTAGLHHPIRHYADSVKTKMHGFFNVFGAGFLGYAYDLKEEGLVDILRDEDPSDFRFDGTAFSWEDLSIDDDQIKELRQVALHSYGSCSFDEPREDLEHLRLLHVSSQKDS
jgi:hypothetical protein